VLQLSRFFTDFLPNKKNPLKIFINVVSGVAEAELEKLVLRQISEHPKKTVVNILSEIVPRRVAQVLCEQFNLAGGLYAIS